MAPASPFHDAFQRSMRVAPSYRASSWPVAPLRAGGITLAPSSCVVRVTRLGLADAGATGAGAGAPMGGSGCGTDCGGGTGMGCTAGGADAGLAGKGSGRRIGGGL